MEEQPQHATARQPLPESQITQSDDTHQNSSPCRHPPQPQLQPQRSINVQLPLSHSQRSLVVQLPVDQIYHFLPSQNETSLVSENADDQNGLPRFSFVLFILWTLLVLVILLFLLCIIAIIFYLVLKPKFPGFFIEDFDVRYPQSQSHLVYNLSIETHNPNRHISIYYLDGGYASMSYEKRAIASGKPPPFYHHKKKTYHFCLLLNSRDMLPKEIEESMNSEKVNKVEIPLALLIKMPVKMKFWSLNIWKMAMRITCDVNVTVMAKEFGLGSQYCRNKLSYTKWRGR